MPQPRKLIATTPRLKLAELGEQDADFIVALLNEPLWRRYIGDRGVRTPAEAVAYLQAGPFASYRQHGFGLWLVLLDGPLIPIGICGLIKRDTLPDVDVGFAFLSAHSGRGYATEAVRAALDQGWRTFDLKRIVAITDRDNLASQRVLEKCGLRFEKMVPLPSGGQLGKLFSLDRRSAVSV